MYAVLGVGSLVLATCGALAAYRGTLFWVGAAQATVLSAVTPLGLALGDPLGLARAAWPPLGRGVGPGLTRLGRVAMFPLLSSVVAAGVLVVLFFTPWFASSLTTRRGSASSLYAVLLLTGTLVVLPLLSTELLPAWCTHPVRALPGVRRRPHRRGAGDPGDDHAPAAHGRCRRRRRYSPARLGPGADVGPAARRRGDARRSPRLVGLPLLGAVWSAWMRADDAEARLVDAELDAQRAGARVPSAPGGAGAAPVADGEPERDRPWWESDPRFSRFRD